MPKRVSPSKELIHDLEVLLKAHHPIIFIDSDDGARVQTLLKHASLEMGMPFFTWRSHRGLAEDDLESQTIEGTKLIPRCLDVIQKQNAKAIYYLNGLDDFLDKNSVVSQLTSLHKMLYDHPGAIVTSGSGITIPPKMKTLVTKFDVSPPPREEIYIWIKEVLADLGQRMTIQVDMNSNEVSTLLSHFAGLTFYEIKRILTQALVQSQRLDANIFASVVASKKQFIGSSGALEYFSSEESLGDIAGLTHLKKWLVMRKKAFTQPEDAKAFGLSAPKGILLLGVQGCGKSLCAKAVASEWGVPLLRLDPSKIYQKYIGESEANLHAAIKTAERLAPVVLWIDEIEKALGGGESDGGTSQRVFGSFLSWMQEKQDNVFVIATANDVRKLPPELLRKGRFDELFFVDLPDLAAREEILAFHLDKRGRQSSLFDCHTLALRSEQFSGAELEQAIVSGLYFAFSQDEALSTEILLNEIEATKPLAVTMSEKIEALRRWASDRTVAAG